jgi:hypothetical protein
MERSIVWRRRRLSKIERKDHIKRKWHEGIIQTSVCPYIS